MKLFKAEGRECNDADGDVLKNALVKYMTSVLSGQPNAGYLKDLGALTLSFEGDERQVGFFHRYDVSCSMALQDVGTPSSANSSSAELPSSVIQECIDLCQETPPSVEKCQACVHGLLKSYLPDTRFSHGTVKLDWVRIGLLGGVVLLFLLLIVALVNGRPRGY
jgi:hypothetical protein